MNENSTSQDVSTRKKFNELFKRYHNNKKRYLIGWRGKSFLEASYVYAPYIPLHTTPIIRK